ncbi:MULTISPECIES: MerR family transcriptional regulator [unclassified Clostridioides]|uniref:MerR family transcriptional regulator n=1 Tax=unclassified Clostridioides TaxID=2635829 RepID=UPI001D0C6B34|nr:MerR family transcriptional regulator [Clostridioides sp. ES-S-0001-02]MCC0641648.1 MerR family transcriptional regulator [Clostridioides sp. ES-S-0049-03]MCC0653190.1 MerR family transcriptional regulator [Clostridioides sp. ES-S-0001-03]MCC0656802.1 MerR family transcriptional regulator [Clostridioides sp. ES-S-0123-01]MCC0673466.1 MerR family transcriptional regulator [Clostridioides sp. ES-S-0145-01]MCC0676181.1 MerR family transcriptional regulator [Clostridioides sp. ES-W-0018-02]MCC
MQNIKGGDNIKTYFSIGEVSRLFDLSIKTLRYYDKVGILKPAYVNQENKYRYYSREQFMSIDVIKYCKIMGMALEDIKKLIDSDSSIDSMMNTIDRQNKMIENKIKELSDVKNYLNDIEFKVNELLKYDLNNVFIKYNKERKVNVYKCNSKDEVELEMYLRHIILHIQDKYNDVYPIISGSISYEKVIKEGKALLYDDIVDFKEREEYENEHILPAGEYLTIIYDDNWNNAYDYYQKIIDYAKNNNIELVGNFNEIWMLSRVDSDTKEKTLVQLEIRKK